MEYRQTVEVIWSVQPCRISTVVNMRLPFPPMPLSLAYKIFIYRPLLPLVLSERVIAKPKTFGQCGEITFAFCQIK